LHPLRFVDPFLDQSSQFGIGLRRLQREISQADQVIGSRGKGEGPSYLEDPTMPNLPQQGDRLQLSEALFNAFPPRIPSSYQVVLWKQESFAVPIRFP
jgi:hypothetical protein